MYTITFNSNIFLFSNADEVQSGRNNGSPNSLSSTLLLCLNLKHDSGSICENHPAISSLRQVLRFLCVSQLGVSVFMAPYQPLMEDS